MSLQKWMYLLDNDNLIIDNKIFIDLMWYIARNKDNGPGKPKGMVTITKGEKKGGRVVLNVKSYVIRNAGIMFQHIFYWHMNYMKKGRKTPYQYKGENVIKMDFEDWWDERRLTDTDVTSANKFLVDTGLVAIHKMRIKHRDEKKQIDVFKPSNCYAIKQDVLELFLGIVIDISKDLYKEKVEAVRNSNIESSTKAKMKKKKGLSTENPVTLETGVTLETEESEGVENDLSTLSTVFTSADSPVTLETKVTIVTPETSVTIATPETKVTIVTPETKVANKSDTTTDSSTDTTTENTKQTSSLFSPDRWEEVKKIIRGELSEVSFNTWIGSIKNISADADTAIFEVETNFSKEILETRYNDTICKAIRVVTGRSFATRYVVK